VKQAVILVDDHRILRQSIRTVLEQNGYDVIAEVGTGSDAISVYQQFGPAIVIMDLNLPGGLNGIDTTIEIRRSDPQATVLVLSMHDDEATVLNCLRAGARGYVLKDASVTDLIEGLRLVAQGGTYLSPRIAGTFFAIFTAKREETKDFTNGCSEKLTARERQVLGLIAAGKTNKDVASLLKLSPETVRSYRKSLMKKLGVNNVAALVRIALRSGMMNANHQESPGELSGEEAESAVTSAGSFDEPDHRSNGTNKTGKPGYGE
jgi:DNA-binding NarL/FixJ family response regulator